MLDKATLALMEQNIEGKVLVQQAATLEPSGG
jgi:hypothetical protein